MDTSIAKEVSARKKRNLIIIVGGALTILILGAVLIRSFFKSTINRNEINIAVVQTGDIENTINASGEVLPEFEEVLTSPINASVRSVSMEAGKKVNAGESILTLDKSAAQTDFDKLGFQIESKENEIRKLKLDLEKSFYDIKSNNKIKQLRISNLIDAVSNAKRLFKAGGGTREGIEQAELNLKVAELEKQQLENEILSKQQTMKIEIREAEISLAIQQNDQMALKRKLNLANVQAARPGVVTWLNRNIGAMVREGDPIARIADLSSFKVAGTISDNMLDQVSNNMPAIIRTNDILLRGHISNISPSVSNSLVSFDVQLDERNHKALRPNMKVELFLVTETRSRVTIVANGAAFKGARSQEIFVLKNGRAERRTVTTGLSNFDFIEIVAGVKPGEVVITTDMSDYKNTSVITVSN
jgi:HlyD family secretion protein